MDPADDDDELPPVHIGDLVAGRYLITSLIGRGAMGFVFAVIDQRTGQFLALKMLSRELANDPVCRERFLIETQLTMRASSLSENVIQVVDAGLRHRGLPYLVMERLRGETLAERLVRGPIPFGQMADIAIQACLGLAHAHALGIVHRDIKPSNLFLDQRCGVKVIDFGLAKSVAAAHAAYANGLTSTGVLLGSPSYMAPEQMEDPKRVDHRVDIWSMGVVLYVALSGHRPFGRRRLTDTMLAVMREGYPRLAARGIDGSQWSDPIIERCLAKDPRQRFAHVGELAAALAPFASRSVAGHVHALYRSFPTVRTERRRRRASSSSSSSDRRRVVAVLSGFVLSLGLFALSTTRLRAAPQPQPQPQPQLTSSAALTPSPPPPRPVVGVK